MTRVTDIKTGIAYDIEWSISIEPPYNSWEQLHDMTLCTIYKTMNGKQTQIAHSCITRKHDEECNYWLAMSYSLAKASLLAFPSSKEMLRKKRRSEQISLEEQNLLKSYQIKETVDQLSLSQEERAQAEENKRVRSVLWFALTRVKGIKPEVKKKKEQEQEEQKQKNNNNGTIKNIEARASTSY